MNGNEISELASLLPSPAAGKLPDERANVLRENMMAEFRRAPEKDTAVPPRLRRRPARIALTGTCLVAAAAAIGSFVVVSATGSPGGANPAAATLLARIASAADQQSSPQVRDSEFMYIRSEVAFADYANGSPTPIMDKLHERQIWLPVANDCPTGLLIEDGESTPLTNTPEKTLPFAKQVNGKEVVVQPGGEIPVRCGKGSVGGGTTYRLLQSLPTNPRTLLNLIYAGTRGQGDAVGPDGEAFTTIGDMIKEEIVPPQLAAALYRAAALIPGVTLAGHVANAVGQPGIGISWSNSQSRSEWIFDPATLQFIGERDFDNVAHEVIGDTAILQKAFVAKVGQLPKP